MMALLLPLWGYCACLRGYFNAVCHVAVPALCDVLEFLLRVGILAFLLRHGAASSVQVCRDLIYSMAAGTFCTAIFLTVLYVRRRESGGTCSLSFGVMAGWHFRWRWADA